jgi:hypothetical protein
MTKSPKPAPSPDCRRRRKESLINGFRGEQAFAVSKIQSSRFRIGTHVVSYNGLRGTLSLVLLAVSARHAAAGACLPLRGPAQRLKIAGHRGRLWADSAGKTPLQGEHDSVLECGIPMESGRSRGTPIKVETQGCSRESPKAALSRRTGVWTFCTSPASLIAGADHVRCPQAKGLVHASPGQRPGFPCGCILLQANPDSESGPHRFHLCRSAQIPTRRRDPVRSISTMNRAFSAQNGLWRMNPGCRPGLV